MLISTYFLHSIILYCIFKIIFTDLLQLTQVKKNEENYEVSIFQLCKSVTLK